MKKKRLNYVFLCLLLASVVASVFIFNSPFQFPQVLAQTEWTDTFNIYTNITVLEPAIRTITNIYDFPIDVKVYITDVTNIVKLYFYKTIGNSTEFVYIKEGVTIRTGDTYTALQPTQTLAFDLLAEPAITLGIGENIVVKKKVEIYKSYVLPPVIILPPIIIKFPLDLKIITLPAIVYQPFQPTFKATLLATNKATVAADVTIKWWVADVEGKIYDGGQTTVFISGLDKKEIEIEVPTPKIDGAYTLHTQSTVPTVVVAEAQFEVTTITIWIIILIIAMAILTILILKKTRKI
jgi:hypothetical protein